MGGEAAEEALASRRGAHARRTRGSRSAIAMSARRLPRMTKNAVNMIMPIRIGYSFIVRASTKSRPMPGQPKIDSVTSAPEKSTGRSVPRRAISGFTALGKAWRPRRADHADRDAEEDRDRECRAHEEHRRRQALDDDAEDRPAAEERVAPIAGEHPSRPFEVLDVDRLVEPEDHFDPLDVLRGDGGVERVDRERPAWRQMHQPEADDRDAEQQRDRLKEPTADIGQHAPLP